MLAHIADTHTIDSIFWTGDNSSHDIWSTTDQDIVDYTLLVTNEIKAAFGDSGIPVYPSTGNHDTWPVNVEDFSAPGLNVPINSIVD
jgi:hypothetical protein